MKAKKKYKKQILKSLKEMAATEYALLESLYQKKSSIDLIED
ncbi:hypothetical protein [Kaistella faecalis]|nr:hypothetical protein [Chryseobacterium faecale]